MMSTASSPSEGSVFAHAAIVSISSGAQNSDDLAVAG
jgi:hypothetical protein